LGVPTVSEEGILGADRGTRVGRRDNPACEEEELDADLERLASPVGSLSTGSVALNPGIGVLKYIAPAISLPPEA
jgi:hypothetical protein